jgi:hypothetical protein
VAFNWALLKTDVMAAIATALPAAVPNGIYSSQETARMSWEIPDGYPYVIVHQGPAPAGDWGLTNDAFEPLLDIYLIVSETEAQGQDPVAAINTIPASLETIKNGLRAATFTNSQATLLEFPEIDWGPLLDVNAILLGKNVPVLGGKLACLFTCGETAS